MGRKVKDAAQAAIFWIVVWNLLCFAGYVTLCWAVGL